MQSAALPSKWTAYRLELLLGAAGLICLVNAGAGWWRFQHFQAHYSKAFSEAAPLTSAPASTSARVALGEPIGRLSVPRLGLSTVVVEGDDEQSLQVGAGHAAVSTPLGGQGNVVIAGHRDSAFWPLRKVRVGDRIRLTAGKRLTYVVRSLTVVDPTDTSLLQPVRDSVLTLVTCYPFRHVGPAPKRFIVRADLDGAL